MVFDDSFFVHFLINMCMIEWWTWHYCWFS